MTAKTPGPAWRTKAHPVTGQTITYAVVRRDGKRIVLVKRGNRGKADG